MCEFPSLVGLLKHPSHGWVLFDTGYSQRFFEATAAFPASLYRWVTPVRFDPRKALAVQLRERGVSADEIGAIVLSHFHADHIAGVLDFPGVPVYCSREGWAALHAHPRLSRATQRLLAELAPSALREQLHFLEDTPSASGASGFREHDLLGDGSLIAVELPGHSPGHYGLRFTAQDDREVMLIGDAAWSTRAVRKIDRRQDGQRPCWVARSCTGAHCITCTRSLVRGPIPRSCLLTARSGDLEYDARWCAENPALVRQRSPLESLAHARGARSTSAEASAQVSARGAAQVGVLRAAGRSAFQRMAGDRQGAMDGAVRFDQHRRCVAR